MATKAKGEELSRALTYADRALVDRFVRAMNAAQMSSNGLAKRTGVDRRTIDRLRNGERIPRPEKLGRLVQPLGVSLDWIINGDAHDVMQLSEPSGPAYRTDALAQSAVGFLLRMRDSGLEDWMKRQPPSKTPSLDAALSALDATDESDLAHVPTSCPERTRSALETARGVGKHATDLCAAT